MSVKNIMIVGVGGQGTLLTSRILGNLAIHAGYDVKLSEVHGMAQRGGSVVTYVRYGEQVAEPIVEEGCADVLIAFEKLEALRYLHYLKEDGVVIVNDWRIDPITVVTGAAQYPEEVLNTLSAARKTVVVKATKKAVEMGVPKAFNVVVLGAAARYMGFEKEDWLHVIEATVPPKTIEVNHMAFEAGYQAYRNEAIR